MTKKAQIPLRVEPKLKEDLEKLAKKDKRSTNNYIEVVLERHIALEKQTRVLSLLGTNMSLPDDK